MSTMSPQDRRDLEEKIMNAMPTWRRKLVQEYGLAAVLSVDASVPERALAQLEARRKERQERLLQDAAVPIAPRHEVKKDGTDP